MARRGKASYGMAGQGEARVLPELNSPRKILNMSIGNMGSEICPRCGTKFEVDNYCERGHTRPRLDPYIEHATSTEALPDLPDETEQLREQLTEERKSRRTDQVAGNSSRATGVACHLSESGQEFCYLRC